MNRPQDSTHHARRSWLKSRLTQVWASSAVWITAPAVAGLILATRAMGVLQPLEWMAYDEFVKLSPKQTIDERILIVGINEQDLQKLSQYPMDDATLAALLTKLKQGKPTAIGLDIFRDFPVAPGSEQLIQLFKTTPNIIGIEKRKSSRDRSAVNPSGVLSQQGQTASNNVFIDGDGKLRRGLLYWTNGDDYIESIGLRLAMMQLAKLPHKITPEADGENLKLGKGTFVPFEANDGSYINADAGSYQMLLNYRGPAQSFRTVSMMDVMEGRVSSDLLRDRIVLVGVTAESLRDIFYTPYSENRITSPEKTAGVEIIANTASHIMTAAIDGKGTRQVWGDKREGLWIILWAGIGAGAAWWIRTPRWAIGTMIGLVSGLTLGSYLVFIAGWWIPFVPPVMALATSAVVLTGYIANLERRDRAAVMNIFGRYVTPTIAEAIWKDREQLFRQGRLKGQKMNVSVLFTDLKNFSTVAERTDPEVLMDWLNEYMEAMTQVVLAHGAVVDKFIGDAVMAIFGVPIARATEAEIQADAHNAVSCAVGMAKALNRLNQKWQNEGRPTLSMRVGICTGAVVTGSLGSQQRMDYTAIGDTVNIAARLESFDKTIDGGICRILISDRTHELTQADFEAQDLSAESIGSVHLKGREQSVSVYQVFYDLPEADSA
ncbi:adenylate/guanylate cyclase domain-containing protein [filamentous cyanobacterium LEGE 11480]|uniref:Adenylate/guanylate cyclase domain-containing protein n=1 Tax=Romeriopsis navalis LEGE 11480 TaxID=2777977 RepID=A0A928VQT5_9CYAN|nr:adenylate/guanylate cyclase domain-containing protein [Romeriopsis navalis]MBE9031241.1 adenylate/guanylate cyclase domain-containing protein [Romeriopsis navalis LEGE 11480]